MSSTSRTPKYVNTRLLINGEWCDGTGGKTVDVISPSTGKPIGTVAYAKIADLDEALASAQRGFNAWKRRPAHERSSIMRTAAALVRERVDDIALLLTQEQGKPIAEARTEVLAGADIIEWFADEARRVYGRIIPSRSSGSQQLVLKEPVGPVAAFTPWNFPVNQIVRKLGAALATGCSILVKAPEETPAAPAALLQAFVDAGVPPGTVGLVFGDPAEISSYLIASPVVRKVTFTGSTPVGKHLAGLAGRHMKRVTMELGGHAPVIDPEHPHFQFLGQSVHRLDRRRKCISSQSERKAICFGDRLFERVITSDGCEGTEGLLIEHIGGDRNVGQHCRCEEVPNIADAPPSSRALRTFRLSVLN